MNELAQDIPESASPGVAVVTGGSRGIGRAIAQRLARVGWEVVVHGGHDRAAANGVATEITTAGGVAHVLMADLAQAAERRRLVDEAWQWRGHVDAWVNNAGADVLTGAAAKWDFQQKLDRLWRVDVCGTIDVSRSVGQRMRQHGRGAIVNMGWDQATFGMGGDSGEMFAAVKGAVMAFSQSLARSLAPQVRVNCVAPGWIRTAWGDSASDYWSQRAQGEALLQRWGTPEDVAAAVAYLVSPEASFVNGQTLCINGGLQPWPMIPPSTPPNTLPSTPPQTRPDSCPAADVSGP